MSPSAGSAGPGSLGALLRQAREAAGLDPQDVAESTHVRTSYLQALEEGAYDALPEDIYARNFVRLYARALDVDVDEALARYRRERHGEAPLESPPENPAADAPPDGASASGGAPAFEPGAGSGREPARSAPTPGHAGRAVPRWRLPAGLAPLLATVLLVGVLVGIAVWGFDRLLFQPERSAVAEQDAGDGGGEASSEDGQSADEADLGLAGPLASEEGLPDEVLLSVRTEPEGAEVMVDAFPLPGTTPIDAIPVTARDQRTVRIEREGFETYEASHDLSEDRTLEVTLDPLPPAGQPVEGAEGDAGTQALQLEVTQEAWLEVYPGEARGEGDPLVYTTAQPGDSFSFDLPVYVFSGNAGGLEITLDGEPQPPLGGGGAVVGQAFPETP